MEQYSSSDSNISLDSLEAKLKKKSTIKKKNSDDNVDTILVPFYEKDVLMKVPKGNKSKLAQGSNKSINGLPKRESSPSQNYLMNRKGKRTSYLEMFRKQFSPSKPDSRDIDEIRSISPEFGDTERESFREEPNNPATDFLDTEAYNEIYYDKLINQELNHYLEKTYEEQLKLTYDIRSKSPENFDDNNLRSVSNVSQPRRNIRRATIQPMPNIKLGGLGPDMENIKPRLERARSLQRYSEKVRMENRVRIYKKSVQEEIEKKAEKDSHVKRQNSKLKESKGNENSFLVNKNTADKTSQMTTRIFYPKSKSASAQQTKVREEIHNIRVPRIKKNDEDDGDSKNIKKGLRSSININKKERIKSCDAIRNDIDSVIKHVTVDVPPVQISFLVNMSGIRPSSALRKLEAKHRMYQEKVKEFHLNQPSNIGNDNDDNN